MSQLDQFDYKSDFEKVNLGIAERFLRFSKEFNFTVDKEVSDGFIQGLQAKLLSDFQQLIGSPHNEVYNTELIARADKRIAEIEASDMSDEEKLEKKTKVLALKNECEYAIWSIANNEYTSAANVNYYTQLISYIKKLTNAKKS